MVVGARGFVGSTYNFAAPIYQRVIENFQAGNIEEAKKAQYQSARFIDILIKYGSLPAIKETMKLIGIDCGPVRLPLKRLTPNAVLSMEKELQEIGFFEWIASPAYQVK